MTRTSAPERHGDPADGGPGRLDFVLRLIWIAAAFLAFLVGVFVVPGQFVDAHHEAVAQEIERSGAEPYPVLEVRQKVDRGRRGHYDVEMQVATYRTGTGTATVRLLANNSTAVAREQGWLVSAGPEDRLEVYVAPDGRHGFLLEDYRPALDAEYDGLYRVGNIWVAGWALVGLAALTASSVRRARREGTGPRRAALAPAVYAAVAAALVAGTYAASFSLAGLP